jgi:hypothetical protein
MEVCVLATHDPAIAVAADIIGLHLGSKVNDSAVDAVIGADRMLIAVVLGRFQLSPAHTLKYRGTIKLAKTTPISVIVFSVFIRLCKICYAPFYFLSAYLMQ